MAINNVMDTRDSSHFLEYQEPLFLPVDCLSRMLLVLFPSGQKTDGYVCRFVIHV